MSAPWSTLTGAIRYGYAPHYVVRIEGIPTLFAEHVGDGMDGDGYHLDASLVIDGAARIGSVLSDSDHFAGAKDFEFRLMDTPKVRALMSRPTAQTVMTADFAHDDAVMYVASTAGFPESPSILYFGTSCIEQTYDLIDAWTSLDHSTYPPARSYKAGTVVTDTPGQWKGRRVELFMALVDPTGRYVQDADILSQACCIWTGYLSARPTRNGTEWEMLASDQVQRMRMPLSAAAQGSARWALDDDGAIYVDRGIAIGLVLIGSTLGFFCNISDTPFDAEPAGPILRSRLRALIVERLLAIAPAEVGDLKWVQSDSPNNGPLAREWVLNVYLTGVTDTTIGTNVSISGQGISAALSARDSGFNTFANPGELQAIPTQLCQGTVIVGAGLSITVEDADPATLPTAGFVRLDGGESKQLLEYVGLTVDTADAATVHLQLAPGSQPLGSDILIWATDEVSGTVVDISATFIWRDEGPIEDIMRRAIVSSGDATNGTWDTLARGQGYGLGAIDADSFEEVFDGAFGLLSFVLAVDSGVSLAKLMGGILRIAQCGIAARRAADGSAMQIAAVNVGPPSTLEVAATIRDSDLAFSSRGTKPIRVRDVFAAPQSIQATCKVAEIGDQEGSAGVIIARSPDIIDWTGDAWKLEVYGVSRSALLLPMQAWATSWFRACERQIVEIDLPPWQDIEVGDVIALDLDDVALWDYSRAAPGFHGLARVLGVQTRLETGVQTVLLALDGARTSGPMAPSIQVVAVNGADPTAPTSIDVAESWFPLLTLAIAGDGPWYLLAYVPGSDDGAGQFAVDAIVLTGGVCRITFDALPEVTRTFTTSDRITFPVAAYCVAGQLRYLQNTDLVQWS